NVDKSAPTITVSASPPPNANGWNNTDVVVSFTCSDGTSGAGPCPEPMTVHTEGAQQTVTRTVTDKAGNIATASIVLNIDTSAPTIIATALPPPNAAGWNDTNVTVNFTCADGVSSIAVCPAPITVPTEGRGQAIAGTAVDKAGNTASASITLNIDKTGVSITPSVQPPPNAAGWNNTNVTVTFTCRDGGAAVAACPAPALVTTEGANQMISGTATDVAGNQTRSTVAVNIDKTPPQISAGVSPPPNATGWTNRDTSVSFTCADPGGSGIAQCPAAVTLGEGAGQTVNGAATDIAGNTAAATATVSVDKTPPAISYTITPRPNAAGWLAADATITFTCSDSTSGILSCPRPITVTSDGANQAFSGTA